MTQSISLEKLAHQEHADLLDDLEAMADLGFSHVIDEMITEITKLLSKEKLIKSKKLPRGWTGEAPKIEIDFNALLTSTINKYMNALRYILLGKLAGPEATADGKGVGVPDKVIPGIVQSAYLDSIDTHRVHGEGLTGKPPRAIQKDLVLNTMSEIKKRTERYMDESLMRLQNRVLSAIELEVEKVNQSNLNTIGERAQAPSEPATSVPKTLVSRAVREAAESHRTDWHRLVEANTTLASAVGTHQAVQELYARDDDDVRVAWVAMRDEKTCKFCKDASRNPDGSFKLYRMSDFQPAGFNYGRKRDAWQLCIPGAHPNCRCTLVYIPKGFEIDKSGTVLPKKK